eukprot:gene1663-biopygen11042
MGGEGGLGGGGLFMTLTGGELDGDFPSNMMVVTTSVLVEKLGNQMANCKPTVFSLVRSGNSAMAPEIQRAPNFH